MAGAVSRLDVIQNAERKPGAQPWFPSGMTGFRWSARRPVVSGMIIILVDNNRQTFRAERIERGWICPRDGGDLGDRAGYRAPRVGSRCPKCGAAVFKVGDAQC